MTADLLVQHMISGSNFYRAQTMGASIPMTNCMGDVSSLTPQQSAVLINLGAQYATWRDTVLSIADRTGDSEGAASNIHNLVNAASRQFNKLIQGDMAMGSVLQTTMSNTMAYIREVYADNSPTLNDAYIATGQSIRTLITSITSTAGAGAGALIKAAADEAGIEPAEITGGVSKIALAVGLAAGAIVLTQLSTLASVFKRKNPQRKRRRA